MYVSTAVLVMLTLVATPVFAEAVVPVRYQAHRGGLLEVPENTMTAYRHAWGCPGAVPEIDVCVTQDGALVCMHDDTPARTTDAPESLRDTPIAELALEQIRGFDAGVKFAPEFAGEKVPVLTEVFDEMKDRPDREAYLDLKNVDLDGLLALIDQYGLRKQVIFVHGDPETCLKLSRLYPGARTMTWLSGSPDDIRRRFDELAAKGFAGISQIQLHLRTKKKTPEIEYVFDNDYLRQACQTAAKAGSALQVRPFDFDAASLERLVALGIRWFVTDEPKRFSQALE